MVFQLLAYGAVMLAVMLAVKGVGALVEQNNRARTSAQRIRSPSSSPEIEQTRTTHEIHERMRNGSDSDSSTSSSSSRFTEFDQTGARAPLAESRHRPKPHHPVYKDVPLPPRSNYIRVLVIKRTGSSTNVECEMKRIRLEDEYEALSYTWGDENETAPINVNGQTFIVTRNLRDALFELHWPKGATRTGNRVLWVDAVCINQNDIEEKNREIVRMRDIYSSARNVVVWLGKGTAESDEALDYFNKVLDTMPSDAELARTYTTNSSKWHSLAQGVLEREWWTRIWIIQEIVLARHVVMVCGSRSMAWDWLALLVIFARDKNFMLVDYGRASNQYTGFRYAAAGFEAVRRRHHEFGPFPLAKLVTLHSKHESSKVVDKIYGLLGMAADLGSYDLQPDYRLNPAIVFMQTTERLIHKTGSLDIIALGRRRNRLPGLPSWCPDYRTKSGEQPIPFTQHNVPETPGFSASGYSEPTFEFHGNGEMDVLGYYIGDIGKIGSPSEVQFRGEGNQDIGDHIENILNEAVELATGGAGHPLWNAKYPFGRNMTNFEALSRVLVCDTNANNDRCKDGEGYFQEDGEPPAGFEPSLSYRTRQEAWKSRTGMMKIHWRDQRRIAVLEGRVAGGLFGLVPADSKKDDSIVIFKGCSVPLVLRSKGDNWELIGQW